MESIEVFNMRLSKKYTITLGLIGFLVAIIVCFITIKRILPLAWNMHNKINRGLFSDLTLEGYDPVAYFSMKKAIKGKNEYSYYYKDVNWNFSSEENLKLFIDSSEKYLPQFGGYCCYAVSKGFTAEINPEAFSIIDGKLYMFNDNDFKIKWNEDQKENLKKNRSNWSNSK